MLLFLSVCAMLIPAADFSRLVSTPEPQYLWVAAPVILTAFGFHIVIPSLVPYLKRDLRALKKVLLWGGLLPLATYLLWLAALLGGLPLSGPFSFSTLSREGGSLGQLMIAIGHWHPSLLLNGFVNTFANLAMITSFLGVTLSLFAFLQDKQDSTQPHRLRTASLTFIPPLALAIFYPQGFVQLISFASIFVAIILMLLPAAMAYRLRRMKRISSPYRVPGGNATLVIVFITGCIFIWIECVRLLGGWPIWQGV